MRLFLTDIRALYDVTTFSNALQVVLPWRKSLSLRYRQHKERCLSLGAGLLLSYAACISGMSLRNLHFTTDAYGKPCCQEKKDWHFNLSRSGHHAICVSGDRPAGVDLQKVESIPGYTFATALHPSEQSWLYRYKEGPEKDAAFSWLWSRKEAFLKATGRGMSVDPATVTVIPDRQIAWQGQYFRCKDYPLHGYALNLCLPEGIAFPMLEDKEINELIADIADEMKISM